MHLKLLNIFIFVFTLVNLVACNGGGGASGTTGATIDSSNSDPLYEYSWHSKNRNENLLKIKEIKKVSRLVFGYRVL